MCENHRGRVVVQRLTDHFTGIHGGAIDGAPEQFLVADDPVAVIKKQAGEDLMGLGSQT